MFICLGKRNSYFDAYSEKNKCILRKNKIFIIEKKPKEYFF